MTSNRVNEPAGAGRRRLALVMAAGTLVTAVALASPAAAQTGGRNPLGIDLGIDLLGEDGDVANVGLDLGGLLGGGLGLEAGVGTEGATANLGVGTDQAQASVGVGLLQPGGAAQASVSVSAGEVDAVAEANLLQGGALVGACADVQFDNRAECAPDGSLLRTSAVDGLLGSETTAAVGGLLGPDRVVGACLEITLGDAALCAARTGPSPDPTDPGTPPVDEPPAEQPPAGQPPAVPPPAGQGPVPDGDGAAFAGFRSPGSDVLSDARADTGGGGRGGVLAFTGAGIAQLTALGAGLTGAGLLLTRARRRRPDAPAEAG